MLRLAMLLFSIVATSCAGIGVVVVLTLGHDTLMPVLAGAGVGFLVSIPGTWLIARALSNLQ